MLGANGARVVVRRVILSALAGGGLTAVGLGGPLAGATAADVPTGTTPESGASTTPVQPPSTQTTTTTTSTPTPAPETTTATSTTSTPIEAPAPTPAQQPTTTTTTTNTTTTSTSPEATKAPVSPQVTAQRTQEATTVQPAGQSAGEVRSDSKTPHTPSPAPSGPNNIAAAPQLSAAQSEALAAMLSPSSASIRALDFYRIPLFLLPIYQAAAVQYGVPWPVLAAINEVETNFGSDLSVSTAGAVGWMQFMPETWLQYGVDALGAGYADPYNPVDAVFSAARYLHAAGASTNLRAAILAYNHSEAYVESVLLRARLFASYPASVIGALTGLTEGSLPVAGAKLSPTSIIPQGLSAPAPSGVSSTTAGATLTSSKTVGLPGSTPAPSPAASAASAERALNAAAPPTQLSELVARRGAPVVAVEDGRIVGIGRSHKLGRYLVLRDTYGDLFTYAGLGSIAPRYRLPKPAQVHVPKGALQKGETGSDPAPKQAATQGHQLPLTLHVAKKKAATAASSGASEVLSGSAGAEGEASQAVGKVRVFAHPGNPDAIVAARALARRNAALKTADGWLKLGRGSVVAQGTVLGHLVGGIDPEVSMRFAIRPVGAKSAIDPRPILENWRQLDIALHPQGAKEGPVLAGATASDAFLLSRAELGRAVLADPGIKLGQCDREQIAAGKISREILGLLVFLSRSGLKPTIGELRCGHTINTDKGSLIAFPPADTLYITAINGVPIAAHQGIGTITDITIRTLLTLQHQFAPKRIVSLMKYPGAPSTVAAPDYSTYIKIELAKHAHVANAARTGAKAHASTTSRTAPMILNPVLNTIEWQRLMTQLDGLQPPKLLRKPSSSAIRDKQAAPANRGLGTSVLP